MVDKLLIEMDETNASKKNAKHWQNPAAANIPKELSIDCLAENSTKRAQWFKIHESRIDKPIEFRL